MADLSVLSNSVRINSRCMCTDVHARHCEIPRMFNVTDLWRRSYFIQNKIR